MSVLPPALLAAVQHNCDLADARHAGDYGLCTYLLKMRELFRWERGLPFSAALCPEELGVWLQAREQRWASLENAHWVCLPLARECVDPFDCEAVNAWLEPRGWVYSAGYGPNARPTFFMGELLASEHYDGYRVLIAGKERARDLAAPPALFSQGTIYVRRESIRRLLHELSEAWRWRGQPEDAWARAWRAAGGQPLADAGPTDSEVVWERLTDDAVELAIWHEVGEAAASTLLPGWEERLLQAAGQRQERVARAVRDLLADCLTTLPALLRDGSAAGLHLYFAHYEGLRRTLFPALLAAYRAWAEQGGDLTRLQGLIAPARQHWLATAQAWLDLPPALWPANDEQLARLRLTAPA